jgi:hypothetical protein
VASGAGARQRGSKRRQSGALGRARAGAGVAARERALLRLDVGVGGCGGSAQARWSGAGGAAQARRGSWTGAGERALERRGSGGAGVVVRRRRSWRAGARRRGAGAALEREQHAGSGDGVRGAQRRRRREWHMGGACRSRAPGGVAMQSDDVQGSDVQRMAVSPLGELRPRPSWYAGRSRGAEGAAVRRLRADSHYSNRAARGERRRPLRRKQRTRSGCTANCSWRIWRWLSASRPWSSWRQRGRVWRGKLGRSSCVAARRSGQEQRDAGSTRDAGLMAGSVRFRRRVRMQGNRPRACRLGAVGAGAEQE